MMALNFKENGTKKLCNFMHEFGDNFNWKVNMFIESLTELVDIL